MSKYEELSPKVKAQLDNFHAMLRKKPEEINGMCDSGMFNSIIEGYILLAFDALELTEIHKDKLQHVSYLFEEYSAAEARDRAKKGI